MTPELYARLHRISSRHPEIAGEIDALLRKRSSKSVVKFKYISSALIQLVEERDSRLEGVYVDRYFFVEGRSRYFPKFYQYSVTGDAGGSGPVVFEAELSYLGGSYHPNTSGVIWRGRESIPSHRYDETQDHTETGLAMLYLADTLRAMDSLFKSAQDYLRKHV